ncbi:3-hydroxyacyl-CoA dehydrogenase family protein [Amycolatopsis albispora]|uniref:3-hydroxybutyryl-CoA dehydrogenase n=1 Tax=Amycolatopsis albispora TaxID=1804986 RepID=A0A344L5I0_9PSEU|nr:3-hydroxyacyl-CoA dehydrogenase NAD-binding domain-containing protein [Amycolatopsis albispora]AXB43304.1 3-hydroxybutyryl-CoA dehydrogenase [Amycolatopsis albispora]
MRQQIGVVGAGTMGLGVTHCLAEAGFPVVVVDPVPEALGTAPVRLAEELRRIRLVRRDPAAAPVSTVTGRVRWTGRFEDLAGTGFVLECAPERIPLKEAVFAELDRCCPAGAVLASVTSAIPIDRLAACTRRPAGVVGLHFMNPAPMKETVELVRGPRTGPDTLRAAGDLLAALGKTGIVVADGPGFALNRVLMPAINEAAAVVGAGTADAATVDRLFQQCLGHQLGPLRTADLIGLDTVADTLGVLAECTGEPRFTPDERLLELIAAGHLGRKTGRGFHHWR